MRGMHMRHEGWAELVNDEEHGGCLVPIMMLYHEHDEDPEMRPDPISPKQREEVIVHMAAGLVGAYRYFRAQRDAYANSPAPEPRRGTPQGGAQRSVPVRVGEEVQEVLRRGEGELMPLPIEKLIVRQPDDQPDAQFRCCNLAKLSSPCEPL